MAPTISATREDDRNNPADPHEQHEHHEHIEYTDQQIEHAHEVLGISGQPYLILESDAARFVKRGIEIDDYMHRLGTQEPLPNTTFFAPGAIPKLLMKNKYGTVNVEIGPNSNVQEIDRMEISEEQEATIRIGAGSSLAHAVKLDFPKGKKRVVCDIGNNVFVGIGTYVSDCKIGDNCSIGFKCRLKTGVTIGDFVTVCDGAIVQGGLKLEPFTVVPPGLVVNRSIILSPTVSPAEYVALAKGSHAPIECLIRFTEDEQEEILAEEKKQPGVGGNTRAHDILEKAGVDASSLFLTQFNRIVVGENRLFPLIYRLINKFHPEHQQSNDRSSEGYKYGNNVMIVDLPLNRTAFIKHYMDQVEQGVAESDIRPYSGEFSTSQVEWAQVRLEGETHLIGPVTLKGKTVIGKGFVARMDEGKPEDRLIIDECTLSEVITAHAVGNKHLYKVEAGHGCVFHGNEVLEHCYMGESVILHNVEALRSQMHGNSILLGTKLERTSIGPRNTVIGHHGQIELNGVGTGDEVVVLHNVKILGGQDPQKKSRIWLGDGVKVNHNTLIFGEGEVENQKVFGPNGIYEISTEQQENVRKVDNPNPEQIRGTAGVPELLATIHGSVEKNLLS